MTPDDSQPISVLLVEDDPGDVVLIEEAFEHNKVRNVLKIVGDGVEAMNYLRRGPTGPTWCCSISTCRARRARGAGRDQVRSRAALDPGRGADDLQGRGGHPALLRPARERLRHQAGRLQPLHRGRAPDRRVLRHRRQAPGAPPAAGLIVRPLVVAVLALVVSAGGSSSGGVRPSPSPTASSPPPTATASPAPAPTPRVPTRRTVSTGLDVPWGIAFLPGGDALVAERTTAKILRIAPDGGRARTVMT